MFVLTDNWFPVDALGIAKAFLVTIVFSAEGIVTLLVALLTTYLFLEERQTLARNSEL